MLPVRRLLSASRFTCTEPSEYAMPPIQRRDGSSSGPAAGTTVPIRARGLRLRATTSGSRAEPTTHSTPQHAARAAAPSLEPIPPRPVPPTVTRTARASAGDSRAMRSVRDASR